jgi:hypothetical protein
MVLKKRTAEIRKKPKQTAASITPYGFETPGSRILGYALSVSERNSARNSGNAGEPAARKDDSEAQRRGAKDQSFAPLSCAMSGTTFS